jgi:hypothetical protein
MSIEDTGGPVNLDDPAIDLDSLPLSYWYTASDAAAALSRTSKKEVDPAYLRSLTRAGAPIRTRKLGPRSTLYLRHDVDRYIVEPRGQKAARAQKLKAEQRSKKEKE